MRHINAPRSNSGRRAARRRRSVASAAPARRTRPGSYALAVRLAAMAAAVGHGLIGFARSAFAKLKSIPFAAGYRRVAGRARAAQSALGAMASAAGRHSRALLCTGRTIARALPMAGLSVVRGQLAQAVAAMRRTGRRVRRVVAGIRLPDVPGGDPVVFGATVGAAIIIAAGLVVLLASELRKDERNSASVAELSERGWGRLLEDWVAPAERDDQAADAEAELPPTLPGPSDGVTDPAPVVALAPQDPAAAVAPGDENENVAAALPLLDIPENVDRELALIPPDGPSVPVPPAHDARPSAPAAPQWLANAVQPRPRRGKNPMIAIVIDDAGIAQARTARAIDLPPPLTIAFIPYGRNLDRQARRARESGHELLLHIPMEASSTAVDPGPNALLTSLDGDEIMRRFRWALSRFDGYVGVNNHMGSKFMARADLLEPLLAEMNARGLMFLDSRTDRTTVGASLARGMDLPHASRQVFLDNVLEADRIAAQLAELERVARRRGHAIAIGHPHDVTVDVLAAWIPEARARGFDLVPVSAIVKLEYGDDAAGLLAAAPGGGEADGLLGSPQ